MFVDASQNGVGLIEPKMTASGIQQQSAELAAGDKIQSGARKPSLVHPRPLCEQHRQGKRSEHHCNQKSSPRREQTPQIDL
jgi:hypothetical protein